MATVLPNYGVIGGSEGLDAANKRFGTNTGNLMNLRDALFQRGNWAMNHYSNLMGEAAKLAGTGTEAGIGAGEHAQAIARQFIPGIGTSINESGIPSVNIDPMKGHIVDYQWQNRQNINNIINQGRHKLLNQKFNPHSEVTQKIKEIAELRSAMSSTGVLSPQGKYAVEQEQNRLMNELSAGVLRNDLGSAHGEMNIPPLSGTPNTYYTY